MEDREVSDYQDHSNPSGPLSATLRSQLSSQEFSKLCAVQTSALPGGDYPAADLVIVT